MPHSKRLMRRASISCKKLGSAIGAQDDLLAGGVKGVEGVEELFLGGGTAGQEVDVIDDQHVGIPVEPAELLHGTAPDGADDVIGEGLGVYKKDILFF